MPQYRQGDVYLIPVTSKGADLRAVPRDAGRVILAYGEVTGHAHAILERDAVLWETPGGSRILAVESEADLVHDEHDTIRLPAGLYEVRRQREWTDADEPIEVAD